MDRRLLLFLSVVIALAILLGLPCVETIARHAPANSNQATRPTPTMSFAAAEILQAGGKPIDLASHAATRCFDGDEDGDLDLLVGGGDGRLWLFRNEGTPRAARFAAPVAITADDRDRWGDSYTGLALAQLLGNNLPDLVVCHSGNQISIHENIGDPRRPKFAAAAFTIEVQPNCQGRFDAADWNGDGLTDLITGSFDGQLVWYRNQGTARAPKFDDGEPFFEIRTAYNSHPRLIDFNQDGRLDLLLGINWGTVSLYLQAGDNKQPALNDPHKLQWAKGGELNIREQNGDDTTPELADLNGDGVLDLISGGKNGQLFFMAGESIAARVTTFQDLLAQHGEKLGPVLRDDAQVCEAAFASLASLQTNLNAGWMSPPLRQQLYHDLAPLARQYPHLLQRAKFDLESSPHLPLLAAQYWVVVFESLPDSPAHRQQVAAALGFTGGYRDLLIDLGVLFIDNHTATPDHLAAMHRLMTSMPRGVWDVETITVAGWLGPAVKTHKIRFRAGVNIFDLPLGQPENSFAADSPRPGVTDVYLICLAHELAHNMLDTVGRQTRPDLYERKFAGLAQAAGPDVIFHTPQSRGIDMAATRQRFQQLGVWNGDEANWPEAWRAYFDGKEKFDRAYTRGNIRFFLDAPQEAFATLANQYFTDSQLMLEFCKTRWDAGHRANILQFLLIADYLSEGRNQVNFYTLRPRGELTVEPVTLNRDTQGRITQVTSKTTTATWNYDNANAPTSFKLRFKKN